MKKLVFYLCEVCGNLVWMIEDSGMVPKCCGREMTRLEAAEKDGPFEKHLPSVSTFINEVYVKVGSVEHPMTDEHYIMWVCAQTDKGAHFRYLLPDDKPEVLFSLSGNEKCMSVYEYCSLHGLWRTVLPDCLPPSDQSELHGCPGTAGG